MKLLLLAASLLLPLTAAAAEGAAEPPPEGAAEPPAEGAAPPAVAGEEPAPAAPGEGPSVLLAVRAGGNFPRALNDLSTTYALSLGGGWVIPALERRLAVVGDLGYTHPTREETIEDPRVGGGSYSYKLIQHDLTFFVGGQYHFAELTSQWVPYAALGARVHLLDSEIDGAADGAAFGVSDETSTKLGGAARGGIGLKLGPGLAVAELELGFAPIDHAITGEANVGNLTLALGYTLLL